MLSEYFSTERLISVIKGGKSFKKVIGNTKDNVSEV